LVRLNRLRVIEFLWCLWRFDLFLGIPDRLRLMPTKRGAKLFIEFPGDDRLRKLVEVPAKDVGSIVDCVAGPVKPFAVPRRSIEERLELLDALCRTAQSKYALYISCYEMLADIKPSLEEHNLPFSFKYTPHFATTIGT
jgi:hypothetical protein